MRVNHGAKVISGGRVLKDKVLGLLGYVIRLLIFVVMERKLTNFKHKKSLILLALNIQISAFAFMKSIIVWEPDLKTTELEKLLIEMHERIRKSRTNKQLDMDQLWLSVELNKLNISPQSVFATGEPDFATGGYLTTKKV